MSPDAQDAQTTGAATDMRPGVSCVNVQIPTDDGVLLAATLYLPDPGRGPQPCILEALPYRKDDLTWSYRDDYLRLAGDHGYAVCRLDLRGTGSSGGDATDEYPAREQQDLVGVIAWLARQDWCDGSVGMYGTSYSGFNSLQLACEQPPELKAIIPIYASDDRYTDDVHYRGGQLRFIDLVDYCHYMTPMNALPPVPELWGADWRDEWRRRINTNEPWLLRWLAEQLDGPYWRHGSVRPDYERIRCPVMIVAGWADGYRNNSFRTIEALRAAGVPCRLLAGPWAHASANTAAPGPRIDLMTEMVAWWDTHLRPGAAGAPEEAVRADGVVDVFVRRSTRPEPDLDTVEGHWLREEWPCPRVAADSFTLDGRPPAAVDPAVGVDAWIDCAGHLPWGQSLDQRHDDAASMTWEDDAGERTLLGYPVARLRLTVDQPVASVSVKLCDVFPDGTSVLVSRGSLNLTHREGHTSPAALVPGEMYDVEVELDACAYEFEAGQRLRVSVAGVDWPNTAAPPVPVTLTIHTGEVVLPVWQPAAADLPADEPTFAPGDPTSSEDPEGVLWQVSRDVLRRTVRCSVDHGSTYEGWSGSAVAERYAGWVEVDRRSFVQTAHSDVSFRLGWPAAEVCTRATLDLRADEEAYEVDIWLEARERHPYDEQSHLVAERHWHERILRQFA
jgi:putative CocE/NonD family hydrolase